MIEGDVLKPVMAELLSAVPGAGRAFQATGQARAERAQMVCDC